MWSLFKKDTGKNEVSTEAQYEQLLIEGIQYLQQHIPDLEKKELAFSASMCLRMVEELGQQKITNEFRKRDYEDPQFVHHLSSRVEFGVPVFIIQGNIYDRVIDTNKLLPVVTALNFSLSQGMATVFNKLNLRQSTTPCVYSNSALIQLVNRTMGRFKELDKAGLNMFSNVLLKDMHN